MAANRIPPEILRQIFSNVEITDLHSLSMANPRWYDLTQEVLYKAPFLFPVSLTQFLRTVLTPGCDILASHVQTLTVNWQSYYAEPIGPVELPLFRTAAQNLGLSYPLTLTDDHVALLLHLLPRVNKLHLWPADTPSTNSDFLGVNNGRHRLPLALRSVTHLSCTWVSNQRGVTSDMLLTILTLPNIQTIEVQILDEIDDPYPAATDATSSVSTLHISYSEISIPSLGRILLVPRALTHLSFASTITTTSIDLGELHSALEPVRNTLQMLELITETGNTWTPGPGSTRAASQSFSEWPMLSVLRCPLRLLLGDCHGMGARHLWDVLPLGLCDLEVWMNRDWSSGEVVSEFVALMGWKEEVVPRLRRGAVGLDLWTPEVLWQRLRSACEIADVELVSEGTFQLVGVGGEELLFM
ncbi:hypothetical protein Q9L58_005869 [Maublancomyces gigas]|uniref:F-box domain-containing protein n=1 Tax=Discina gigas TaxID=1032678 RepID=A0ABR3GH90_9PEZI